MRESRRLTLALFMLLVLITLFALGQQAFRQADDHLSQHPSATSDLIR